MLTSRKGKSRGWPNPDEGKQRTCITRGDRHDRGAAAVAPARRRRSGGVTGECHQPPRAATAQMVAIFTGC